MLYRVSHRGFSHCDIFWDNANIIKFCSIVIRLIHIATRTTDISVVNSILCFGKKVKKCIIYFIIFEEFEDSDYMTT